MIHNKETIHLALAFDQNFITPFYVLITSIFKHNKQNKIIFHTIATGVDEGEIAEIKRYVGQSGGEIIFYKLENQELDLLLVPKDNHFTIATYYRLFFPKLVHQGIKRLLYIDTDTVVVNDLSDLINLEIGDYPVAAVSDSWPEDMHSKLGIKRKEDYFNAGVLLINIPEWNKQEISMKAIQYVQDHPENILIADQDALNAVLQRNWFKINNRFNLTFSDVPADLPRKDLKKYLQDKVIVHYTTKFKPWHISCAHRLKYLYHYYKKKSPKAHQKKYVDLRLGTVFTLLKKNVNDIYMGHPELIQIWRKFKR